MTKPSLSPLQAVEEIAYQKLKDKPFTISHYLIALAFLTIIPAIIASFFTSDIAMLALGIVVAIAWVVSRVAGRVLSRSKGYDSVLAYRYFSIVPWIMALVSSGFGIMFGRLDSATHILYVIVFWLSIALVLLQILGIVIHHKKSKKMIKNIKKEDLFQ